MVRPGELCEGERKVVVVVKTVGMGMLMLVVIVEGDAVVKKPVMMLVGCGKVERWWWRR